MHQWPAQAYPPVEPPQTSHVVRPRVHDARPPVTSNSFVGPTRQILPSPGSLFHAQLA
eukprot:CAMPEP_0172911942 /NCGR_PEP_ID=MMETSP1075-20121228/187540_1 /TAXON_ID=2916 /ORGANISM="Ceratium fusus, Strain PA161109" /LENGTH=57 /DNA_ID=CAMNT_0013770339 /DNA_START=546 /DNA_END=719 /DNA_ORIENTATION=+